MTTSNSGSKRSKSGATKRKSDLSGLFSARDLRNLIGSLPDNQVEVVRKAINTRDIKERVVEDKKREKNLKLFRQAAKEEKLGRRLSSKPLTLYASGAVRVKLDFSTTEIDGNEVEPWIREIQPEDIIDLLDQNSKSKIDSAMTNFQAAWTKLVRLGKKFGIDVIQENFDDLSVTLPGYKND